MAEDWFVRVQGKEYGPVDLETLHEWKAEGRLIPQNEVRNDETAEWLPATQFPELFGTERDRPLQSVGIFHRRSFGEIIAETFQIYARGFVQFFALALFVAIPTLALQISLAFTSYQEGQPISSTTRIASVIAIMSVAALLVCWPIFVGGLQFVAAEIAAGRKARLKEALQRAVGIWPRIARLCLVVYGSYFFWTLLPLLLIATVATTPTIPSILIALLALGFQVYMAGRLFINFMFWQQSCTIAGLDTVESLRESKELARSRAAARSVERPLWRGAILASIWVLVLLAVSVAVELPITLVRLRGITNVEDGYAMIQQVMNAPRPDWMTLATYV
ncbi:MAG TPA: DUF4339 domain-containing protein, partial [Chthoniobacterales bacterium]